MTVEDALVHVAIRVGAIGTEMTVRVVEREGAVLAYGRVEACPPI